MKKMTKVEDKVYMYEGIRVVKNKKGKYVASIHVAGEAFPRVISASTQKAFMELYDNVKNETQTVDFNKVADSVLGIVDNQLDGVSAIHLERGSRGGIMVIVTLDNLDLNISDVKECVLEACLINQVDPDGIFLDI